MRTSWRYFSAIPLVESFTDARDGEVYGPCQFILNDGSLMTIMSENLRATVYADGEPLPVEARRPRATAIAATRSTCRRSAATTHGPPPRA